MNVRDLKRFLENMGDDVEVRFASQPNWPFEYNIEDIYMVDLNEQNEENDDMVVEDEYEPDEVVYLVEGNQIGYLPGIVKNTIGW
jgi:hypothetical protein